MTPTPNSAHDLPALLAVDLPENLQNTTRPHRIAALVSAVTIAFGLVRYDLFVRSTFVGRLLNGCRRDRTVLAPRRRRADAGGNEAGSVTAPAEG